MVSLNNFAFLIPENITNRVKADKGLKKIIFSINWLLIEKIIYTGLTFVVGVLTVRYLGPERLGRYSYALSFVGLFMPLVTLGLDNIAIRELVKKRSKKNEIMGNVFLLKAIGSLGLLFVSILASLLYHRSDSVLTIFIIILAFGHLFDSLNVIDYWFRSIVKVKYSALSRIFAVLIYSAIKITLILFKGPLVGFVWASALNLIITSVFYIYFYHKKEESILNWKLNFNITKNLLSSSWPLMISAISITIYMRIDQIIIRSVLGETELGFYSSAVTLSQAGYFLPTIIANTVFPAIIHAKRKSEELYNKRLLLLYGSFLWLSIGIALLISLISKPLITLLYGTTFLPAARVLSIHIWAFVFVSLGIASAKELLTEDKTSFLMYRTILGAIVNVLLNIVLIPQYGILGAAYSIVIAQGISNFVSLLLFNDTRKIFFKFVNSLFLFNYLKLFDKNETI